MTRPETETTTALLTMLRELGAAHADTADAAVSIGLARRNVMRELHARGVSLREIGKAAGVTKQQVSRLLEERAG